jgi:hypothetical protein
LEGKKVMGWTIMFDRLQSDGFFYFIKIGFSAIKIPNSSRKYNKRISFGNHEIKTS